MIFQRITPNEKLLLRTAPPGISEVVFGGKYEIYMVAALEGDSLSAYAVFSHIPGKEREVFLEYLFTAPKERDKGVCSALLKECETRLKKDKVTDIVVRQAISPLDAEEYNSFMEKRGFIPLNLSGRLIKYRFQEMLDAKALQLILKNRDRLPEIKKYGEIESRSINYLLANRKETGFYFFKEECDEAVSRFYLDKDRVSAALIASLPQENLLFISSLYMDEKARKNNVFLSLFSECVNAAFGEEDDENGVIVFSLNNNDIFNGLMKVFNPPDAVLLVLEHIKVL